MPVELRHVRYVFEAAEQGSFRAAARTLGIEQSAISRRIRDLEDEIGVSLFIRSHAGVRLTNAGKKFVEGARPAMAHLKRAADDAGACGRGEVGVVRVGILSSLAGGFLADLFRTYAKRNPAVRFDVIEGAPAAHISAIQRFLIDIAFLSGTPSAAGCDSALLWSERVFVALPSDHELATKGEIQWDDLRGHRFMISESDLGSQIHDCLVKHLAELGQNPNVEQHCVGRDNLMHLVAIGRGLALTSEATIAARFPGVVLLPLTGEVLPFSAIWLRRNDNPALRRLLSLSRMIAQRWPATVTSSYADLERRHQASVSICGPHITKTGCANLPSSIGRESWCVERIGGWCCGAIHRRLMK